MPISNRSAFRRCSRKCRRNHLEPPCTDPYARWCGRGRRVTVAPMPIKSPYRSNPHRSNQLSFRSEMLFQPMPLSRRAEPFNHADWLFEIKWDGFRALLYSGGEGVRLVSRNGNEFKSFPSLCEGLARSRYVKPGARRIMARVSDERIRATEEG